MRPPPGPWRHPSPWTTKGTLRPAGVDGRSPRRRRRTARSACSTPSTTTSPASASRSGRRGRHALANVRGEAALEGEHLPSVHRGLGDGAQFVVGRDDEGLVSRTNLRIRLPHEFREDILPLAVEWDGVLLHDDPELRGGERVAQTAGTRGFQREQSVLRSQGENMFAIHMDVANLPRVLRYDVRYGAGQERVRCTTPELEVGRGPDPQGVPIDRPGTGGPVPQFVERRLALPEESERESRPGGPFAEEDFRRFEGLQVERLRGDGLAHRPDVIEFEGHGTPHRLDRDVHVRYLEGLGDDVSETLGEWSAALGEDQEAFRRRRGVAFQQPPPEPVEDRAVRRLRTDVAQRSTPGDRLELFEEFVVPTQLPHGVEQRRMSPGSAFGEPPEVTFDNRLADLPDRPEARVQVVLGEKGLLDGDLLHGMRGADGTEATAFSDLARAARAIGEEHATVAGVFGV